MSKNSRTIRLGEWDFNEICIEDKDIYSDYIKKTEYPANLWSSNFDFVWAVSRSYNRKILWRIVDDMLVTFTYLRSGDLYLTFLPLGSGGPDKVTDVVYKCLKYCLRWDDYEPTSAVVKVINSMQLDFLQKSWNFDRYFKLNMLVGLEKHFSIQKLITLPGKDFETVRRKINKFHRNYPNAVIRNYTHEDYEKVDKLCDYWRDTSGQKYSQIFDEVYAREIIKHFDKLGHTILVVQVDDRIVGLVSGGALPAGQSWWCLSKFMDEMDGLSELLIVELAKDINKKNPNIELMNAAEDMGSPGLRFFKERFRPVLDLKRFIVKLR